MDDGHRGVLPLESTEKTQRPCAEGGGGEYLRRRVNGTTWTKQSKILGCEGLGRFELSHVATPDMKASTQPQISSVSNWTRCVLLSVSPRDHSCRQSSWMPHTVVSHAIARGQMEMRANTIWTARTGFLPSNHLSTDAYLVFFSLSLSSRSCPASECRADSGTHVNMTSSIKRREEERPRTRPVHPLASGGLRATLLLKVEAVDRTARLVLRPLSDTVAMEHMAARDGFTRCRRQAVETDRTDALVWIRRASTRRFLLLLLLLTTSSQERTHIQRMALRVLHAFRQQHASSLLLRQLDGTLVALPSSFSTLQGAFHREHRLHHHALRFHFFHAAERAHRRRILHRHHRRRLARHLHVDWLVGC